MPMQSIAAVGGLRIRCQHSRSTIIGRSTTDLRCLNWTPQNYGKLTSTSSTDPRLFSRLFSSLRRRSMDTSQGWIRRSPVLDTFYAIYDGSIVFKLETVELPQINIDVLMAVYVGMKIDVYIIVIGGSLQASPYRNCISSQK